MWKYLMIAAALYSLSVWAQTQTKSQCMSTVRARSMSVTSSDAEKICNEDSMEVINCAITKMQGLRANSTDAVQNCRKEWGLAIPTPTPTPKTSPTSSPNKKDSPTPTESSDSKFEEI